MMVRWLRRFIHHVFWRRYYCPRCQCYGAVGNWVPCYACKGGSEFLSDLWIAPEHFNLQSLSRYGFEVHQDVIDFGDGRKETLPPQLVRPGDKHHAAIYTDPDTGEIYYTSDWNDLTIQQMIADGVITTS